MHQAPGQKRLKNRPNTQPFLKGRSRLNSKPEALWLQALQAQASRHQQPQALRQPGPQRHPQEPRQGLQELKQEAVRAEPEARQLSAFAYRPEGLSGPSAS